MSGFAAVDGPSSSKKNVFEEYQNNGTIFLIEHALNLFVCKSHDLKKQPGCYKILQKGQKWDKNLVDSS